MAAPLMQDIEFYRLAILTGMLQPQDAIAWADSKIAACAGLPPMELIEVSTTPASPTGAFLLRLDDLTRYAVQPEDRRAALHRLYELLYHAILDGARTPRQVGEILYSLIHHARSIPDEEHGFLTCADEFWEYAKDEGKQELLDFLEEHRQAPSP